MKCTECKGKGTMQYGDEKGLCVACSGSGVVSQAVQNNTHREWPSITGHFTLGDKP